MPTNLSEFTSNKQLH